MHPRHLEATKTGQLLLTPSRESRAHRCERSLRCPRVKRALAAAFLTEIGAMPVTSVHGRAAFVRRFLTHPKGTHVNHLNRFAAIVAWAVLMCAGTTGAVAQSEGPKPNTEWQQYNGGYDATRFSPLTQIDTKNVASLQEVARFRIPETMSFQSEPVVLGDTIYVTTRENTYAIDARTGAQRWVRHHELKDPGSPGRLGRGVAYADGRVFRGLVDGHVLALDAKTGDLIWDVVGADIKAGEFYTAAPVVWDGRVYLGNAGSDYGGIGHIRAFDAKTGKRLWSFDTVPPTGDAAKTWPDDPKRVKAGGGTYSSYALDPEAGLLYSPIGNPGPDFVRGYRNGDNLYTSSVVALDAKTGELKGYHQLVRNDFHDWDVAASPILFTSKAGRKMVAAAGKNGYLYGLSRDLKDVFFQTPVTRIENVDAPLTAGRNALPAGHARRHQLVWPVLLAAAQCAVRSRHRLGDDDQARRPGQPGA